MKRIIFFLLLTTTVFSQKNTDLFNSNKLGVSRELTISLPKDYDKNVDKKYPLLLLLDGDYLFDPFSGALSYGEYWEDIPQTIIVGINQNQKDERENDSAYDENTGLPTLSGANFFEFIAGELMPYLEKKYRLAPFKIIAGHDTTAGYLNYFLYKDQPIFNAFISLSPELVLNMDNNVPARLQSFKKTFFYYLATAEDDVSNLAEPIKKLDASIKAIDKPIFNYRFDNFPNATHYSLVLYAIPNALYQIFEPYRPISTSEYNNKISILKEGYVDYLTKKYETIENLLGLKMQYRLNDLKAIETAILKNNMPNEFDKLSEITRKSYPKSMFGDYYLGLMYEKQGDSKRAAKYYQNAFTMNEISDLTKDMMMEKVETMKNLSPKK